tara:strand:- start:1089 stop:1352 length:264 start_codon:yes stop_codon:yes gene_type:complete
MCTNECQKTSCPFAFTNLSEQVQNYGCLPTPHNIRDMRVKHGKTWACHSVPEKPCAGGIKYLHKEGLDGKVINKDLLTEDSDWHLYV